MPPIQSTPGDQHVEYGASWVGEVSLLQNDHSIPDMPVTRIAVLVASRPGQPLTGQFRGPPAVRKAIRYVQSSSPGGVAVQLRLPSAARPYCVIMCPAIDPITIYYPHSLQCTLPFCRSR